MTRMDILKRMHTAEHILSAIMRQHYGAHRNLEFHLGKKKTKCDYLVGSRLTEGDAKAIEDRVNQVIQDDLPVTSYVLSRNRAAGYDLWKVPRDAREIRIVKIGDFDAQPCGGTHVSQTGQIGAFHIISHELRENGSTRIRFKVE
ncbi:MAG: hypothetical protein ACE5HO_18970 [bacterium]